jgi:hypothetical protein
MNRRFKKLDIEIQGLLKNKTITSDEIINVFMKYEDINIKTIDKLNKPRLVERNKIKGALRQSINAHGAIDMRLIGSATKRITGALITNEEPKSKPNFNSFVWGIAVGLLIVLLLI